jgi:adenosylcobinamide-GDP ribazoletransferase
LHSYQRHCFFNKLYFIHSRLKKEIQIFFTALMFYTRIPCPKWVTHEADYLNKATRYFPLVGWIVGLVTFAVFWGSHFLFGTQVAVILAISAAILTTGAFHEDGFADACDGFGGGWTKEKILDIMKDSRIGAFGATGLVMLLLLKYSVFSYMIFDGINWRWLLLVLITVHAMARLTAISISFVLPYSREDESSKAKPISKGFTWKELAGSMFFGLLPYSIVVSRHVYYLAILPPLLLLVFFAVRYLKKWLGGYTGDCLGAAEQLAELIIMLSFVAIWKFI